MDYQEAEYPVTIRNEQESDLHNITLLHELAFKNIAEGKIVEELRKNKHLYLSLVCESENEGILIGHVAYSPITSDGKIIGLGLGPVAVLPSFQDKKIGSLLIKTGNKIALEKKVERIFVLGDPGYYSRFGFSLAKKQNYFSKFDPEGIHFMVINHNPTVQKENTFVSYCKEFELVG